MHTDTPGTGPTHHTTGTHDVLTLVGHSPHVSSSEGEMRRRRDRRVWAGSGREKQGD